ncbi:MAG: Hpt domain-containing protein [Campylobacterota bacterium]|nr:Hpt domain-containing protein [Campylobacterota bacterium]
MGVRRDLEANFDFEIVDEFLDHYAMMVDVMEMLIVDLEHKDRYLRSVDELFRIFHNVKSASGFLQLEPMTRLSTFVEDILEQMRLLEGPANDETISWMLEVNDLYMSWQDDLKLDNELTKIKFSLLKSPDLERT